MPSHRPAPSRYFWPAQLAAWSAYGVQQYLGGIGLRGAGGGAFDLLSALDAALGCTLTLGLRAVYRASWHWPPLPRVAVGAAALALTAALYSVAYASAVGQFCATCRTPQSLLGYVSSFGAASYLLMAWSGGYLGVKLAHQLQREREATLRATAAAQQAQLRMLRYQLNPHFLFNALNTLSTRLVERHDRDGEAMVAALAGFLRYALDSDPEQDVSLGEELAAMRRYLAIEQARFGARLRVDYAVHDDARAARIPGLILQPLVENAIKHAIAPSERGGRIAITAGVDGGMLTLEVRDDGDGAERYDGLGIGLRNVRERLQLRYGDRQRLEVVRAAPRGTCARLQIAYRSGACPASAR